MIAMAAAPAAAMAYTVENYNTPATGQLVLSPPKTELDVNPGEVTSSGIVLANQTSNSYTVRAEISYGFGDKQIIMSSSFWAIPWKIILAVISSLIIIVILLSWATRGRRQVKATRQVELDQLHTNYAAVTEAALEEPQETETTMAETGEPVAAGPERQPPPTEPVSSRMPLNELFPSMNDNRMIDIDDDETRKLLRTMIDNEMDLARACITEGKNDEARLELLEARGAAQKLGLLSEVGLIDDMLDWV